MIFRLIASAFLALLLPVAASACSLMPGTYVPKGNFELVAKSDLIFIGKIAEQVDTDSNLSRLIRVLPLTTLKGSPQSDDVMIPGNLMKEDLAWLSNPFDLRDTETTGGTCGRHEFAVGSTVLFILHADAEYGYQGAAFSRWAIDLPYRGAPWEEVVRIYVEAAERPENERIKFLTQYRDALAATAETPVDRLIVNELTVEIMGEDAWVESITAKFADGEKRSASNPTETANVGASAYLNDADKRPSRTMGFAILAISVFGLALTIVWSAARRG